MEQSVEIAPEFGSSALRSSLFIIFVSCCKYKFDFCKVKSVLVSFIFMPASYKTSPPYPAGVVYSLLIGAKTIGLTALTLSLAHAPNRETLPLKLIKIIIMIGCLPVREIQN